MFDLTMPETPRPRLRPMIVVLTLPTRSIANPGKSMSEAQALQSAREELGPQIINEARYERVPQWVLERCQPPRTVWWQPTRPASLLRRINRGLEKGCQRIRDEFDCHINLPTGRSRRTLPVLLLLSVPAPAPDSLAEVHLDFLDRIQQASHSRKQAIQVTLDPGAARLARRLTAHGALERHFCEWRAAGRLLEIDLDGAGAGIVVSARESKSIIAREGFTLERPTIRLDDVEGCDEAKARFRLLIAGLSNADRLRRLGAELNKNLLLVGVPGVGKSMLARALAGELGYPLLYLTGAQLTGQTWFGQGYRELMRALQLAESLRHCVVFIDEIDALGRRSAGDVTDWSGGADRHCTTNGLQVWMDGHRPDANVILVAATNLLEFVEPALLRPGRFGKPIIIDTLDARHREALFRRHFPSTVCPSIEDILPDLMERTRDANGSAIVAIANEAKLIAAAQNRSIVTRDDLQEACRQHLADQATPFGFRSGR